MVHWNSRKEANWSKFKFNQPYARGLERLKEEVLGKTDFDPATLWQWGTMQGMAIIKILKDCEKEFGKKASRLFPRPCIRSAMILLSKLLRALRNRRG